MRRQAQIFHIPVLILRVLRNFVSWESLGETLLFGTSGPERQKLT